MSNDKLGRVVSDVSGKAIPVTSVRPNKWLEYTLVLLALVGSMAVFGLYKDLFGRYQSHTNPKSAVYGVWLEKDVAPFARDSFELAEDRVLIDNRVVSTRFDLSRSELSFYAGSVEYRYQFLNEAKTEVRQLSPSHYNPVFVLSGKHKNNLL